MQTKTIALGVDQFQEIIENNHEFVDKSMLIAHLIDQHHKVSLITRPRRFGKSLNLSMLKAFFDHGCRNESAEWFKDLLISKAGESYEAHRGR